MSNRVGPLSPRPGVVGTGEARPERAPSGPAVASATSVDPGAAPPVELNPARGNDVAGHRLISQSQKELFGAGAVTIPADLPVVPSEPQVNHGANITWSPRFAFR